MQLFFSPTILRSKSHHIVSPIGTHHPYGMNIGNVELDLRCLEDESRSDRNRAAGASGECFKPRDATVAAVLVRHSSIRRVHYSYSLSHRKQWSWTSSRCFPVDPWPSRGPDLPVDISCTRHVGHARMEYYIAQLALRC